MNKYHIIFILLGIVFTSIFSGCDHSAKENSNPFELTGEIKGLSKGKIIVINRDALSTDETKTDTIEIKDGLFKLTGNYPAPSEFYCMIEDESKQIGGMHFYAENTSMSAIGHADSLGKTGYKVKILGDKFGSELNRYYASLTDFNKKSYKEMGINELNQQLYYSKKKLSEEEKNQLKKLIDQKMELRSKQIAEFRFNHIRNNPVSQVSVFLIERDMEGKNLAQIESEIKLLGAACYELPIYARLMDKVSEMRRTEVSYDELFPGISNVSYKLDKSFQGAALKDIIYLGVFSNNNVCAITKNAEVQTISPEGKLLSSFEANVAGNATTIAIDDSDQICVIHSIFEKRVEKIRGRERTRSTPKECLCSVFDQNGKLIKSFRLEGVVLSSGAKVAGDKLLVADAKSKKITIYSIKDEKKLVVIKDLRTCCGILDIAVRNKNQILATGLGGFNVVGYDFEGVKNLEFGQRGKGINDFQGCCNPVSLAYLSNGAIVTVEKDPTRVKIFSQTGAKQIEGIEELVKGCSHISMAVDSKDNLFLASAKKGIIKCIKNN